MKPKLFITLFLVSCLLAGALLFAGCGGNANSEARETLERANSHLENASGEFKKMEELKEKSSRFVEQNADAASIQEMMSIIDDFQESAESALDEVQEATSLFQKTLNMKISNDMKKYLNMKLKALDDQVAMLEKLLEAQELRFDLFEAQTQGISMERLYEYAREISDLDKQANALAEKAEAGLRDANEFYKEKDLDK